MGEFDPPDERDDVQVEVLAVLPQRAVFEPVGLALRQPQLAGFGDGDRIRQANGRFGSTAAGRV